MTLWLYHYERLKVTEINKIVVRWLCESLWVVFALVWKTKIRCDLLIIIICFRMTNVIYK